MFTKIADSDKLKSMVKAQRNEAWSQSVGFYHPARKVFWTLTSSSPSTVNGVILRQSKQCVFVPLLLTFACHQPWNITHLKPTAGTHLGCKQVDKIQNTNALRTRVKWEAAMLKAVIWMLSNTEEVRKVIKEENNAEHPHTNQRRQGYRPPSHH